MEKTPESWIENSPEALLQNTVLEKERVISELECQVEEQRLLRLQESKQIEAKAAKIKDWVSNKLRDLEEQNERLREQNRKCESQLELLRSRLAQLSEQNHSQNSTEDSSRGSYEETSPRLSATALCLAAIKRRSGAFDTREEREQRELNDIDRISRVDSSSGNMDVESPRSLSPKTPENSKEAIIQTLPNPTPINIVNPVPLYSPILSNSTRSLQEYCMRVKLPRKCRSQSPPEEVKTPPGDDSTSLRAKLDAECQQLAKDLQAAVNELVRQDHENHDYSEIYTPNDPPALPLHRFPSWESRIYDVAAAGLNVQLNNENLKFDSERVSSGFNFSVPVFTTVKGRASQIRSAPFSSDDTDSSDGEESSSGGCVENQAETLSRKSLSPHDPFKVELESSESIVSDTSDYAIPPDASETASLANANACILGGLGSHCLEKSGYLIKLGGKFKTWRKRWFFLKNGGLFYWRSQNDSRRRAGTEIPLKECEIIHQDNSITFELKTERKIYYLSSDTLSNVVEWVKILQNVLRRNATKLALEMDNPTLQGWIVKVRNGLSKKCWCSLVGKMFLSFKSPLDAVPQDQLNMKTTRVENIEYSDSDNEDKETYTIGLFPSQQSPIYLNMASKQDKDSWLYNLTIVSCKGPIDGTPFEQIIYKLMEIDGDENSSLWKNPILLHSKECITAPLTTLPTDLSRSEAIKLFKSCQLFMSVPLDASGIDYHVVLAQNALQHCVQFEDLQSELICLLIKQTSKIIPTHNRFNKIKHSRQFLLNATQSLFLCDSSVKVNTSQNSSGNLPKITRQQSAKVNKTSTSVPSSPLLNGVHSFVHKSNTRNFVFIQGWQLLSLAISLFLPSNKLLWYLKQHLKRNIDKSESGKYAAYCQRSLNRTIANGPRIYKPSRMEVLSILMKNPFHHSLPHSVPVHFLNGTYQVIGFDGSTTVEEFLYTLCHEIGCREPIQSGFALYQDDPFDKETDYYIQPFEKICDVISKWEITLREKGFGKFENQRAVTFTFKQRLYRKINAEETDREKLLQCYQINQQVVFGMFPLTKELALELCALMAQIHHGDYKKSKSQFDKSIIPEIIKKYYPARYIAEDVSSQLIEKWNLLRGKNTGDCVRIYLTCTRKWCYFGASFFSVTTGNGEEPSIIAICEDGIGILDVNLQQIEKYNYNSVCTFGGAMDDYFMMVIEKDYMKKRLLFGGISKYKVLEMTRLVADYINSTRCNSRLIRVGE